MRREKNLNKGAVHVRKDLYPRNIMKTKKMLAREYWKQREEAGITSVAKVLSPTSGDTVLPTKIKNLKGQMA